MMSKGNRGWDPRRNLSFFLNFPKLVSDFKIDPFYEVKFLFEHRTMLVNKMDTHLPGRWVSIFFILTTFFEIEIKE